MTEMLPFAKGIDAAVVGAGAAGLKSDSSRAFRVCGVIGASLGLVISLVVAADDDLVDSAGLAQPLIAKEVKAPPVTP
jgi:hypothetical protein